MATIAGVVIYGPEPGQLARQAGRLAGTVDEVVVYANSPLPVAEEREIASTAAPSRLAVIRPGHNAGLGAAYNALVAHAREAGARFLLLLDQDSLPAPDMAARLAATFAALDAAGQRPALVGPRPTNADGRPMKLPLLRRPGPAAGAVPVRFAISSGSLIDVAAAVRVGPFREDFFIDAIDIEWCMRAWHRGLSVWVADAARMDHSLGRGVIRVAGLHLADQPARRLYTFIRNQLAMMRLVHVPLGHKAAMAMSLPARLAIHLIRNRFAPAYRRAIAQGLSDGLRFRLGPPPAF